MKRKMFILTCGLFLIACAFAFKEAKWQMYLAVASAVACYLLAVRLVVFAAAKRIRPDEIGLDGGWFRQKKWETKLYAFLHVKSWKNKFPHYDQEAFDLGLGVEDVIFATCTAEIAHLLLLPLSYLPLIFAVTMHGESALIAGIAVACTLSSLCDLCMLIVQRFNRPRLAAYQKRLTARRRHCR